MHGLLGPNAILERRARKAAPVPSSSSSPAPTGDLARQIDRQVRAHYSLPPEVNLISGNLRPSEFPNYDEITITFANADKKQPYEFLLARDHKTLLRLTKMDLSKDPYVETMNKIDVRGRPTRGNKDAKVVIVNYDDFECPFCSRMHAELFPEIFKEYGDRVLFIYKDYPLEEIHPWSCMPPSMRIAWLRSPRTPIGITRITCMPISAPSRPRGEMAKMSNSTGSRCSRDRPTSSTNPSCRPASRRRMTKRYAPP